MGMVAMLIRPSATRSSNPATVFLIKKPDAGLYGAFAEGRISIATIPNISFSKNATYL